MLNIGGAAEHRACESGNTEQSSMFVKPDVRDFDVRETQCSGFRSFVMVHTNAFSLFILIFFVLKF